MSLYSYRHRRLHPSGFERPPGSIDEIVIEPKKEWYAIKEVVWILREIPGMGRMTIQRRIDSKALKAQSTGGTHRAGRWRISYNALQDFIFNLERG